MKYVGGCDGEAAVVQSSPLPQSSPVPLGDRKEKSSTSEVVEDDNSIESPSSSSFCSRVIPRQIIQAKIDMSSNDLEKVRVVVELGDVEIALQLLEGFDVNTLLPPCEITEVLFSPFSSPLLLTSMQ